LLSADDDLDLLDVSHSVDAGVFTSKVHVTALGTSGPFVNFSDRFAVAFTVAGKAVAITVDRDYTESFVDGADAVIEGVLSVAGTATTAKVVVTLDFKANTVTSAVTVADLEKAVGGALAGKPFTAMSATSTVVLATVVGPSQGLFKADTATAAATASYVFGGSCSGGGTPVPAPTETPTGDPSPDPSPTDEPTDPPTTPSGPVLFDQPRAGCLQFPDAGGDAATNPVSAAAGDTDDDLDLTGVVYKTTADALQVFVKEKKLAAAPSSASGAVYDTHSFTTGFTVGGKAIAVTAGKSGAATATVGGAASTALHPTAAFDTKSSNIVFSVPLADLAALTAHPVSGAAVTALTATSAAKGSTVPAPSSTADSAAPATAVQKTYVVGDNTCFQPPIGKITIDGASGVYSDVSTITANLVDSADAAVEGARVSLALTGMPARTATTDADGDAVFTFPITVPAGAKTAVISFVGSDTVGPTKASAPYTVKLESTVLKAVGSKGAVTATLSENDPRPLANRTVVFTAGKKVYKVKTNAQGRASVSKLAKGTVVKVSFPSVAGYYAAAAPVSAKVQ
jgi:hypothetical protein